MDYIHGLLIAEDDLDANDDEVTSNVEIESPESGPSSGPSSAALNEGFRAMLSMFKIPDLNVHQKQACKIFVDKEDVFVDLPTGFGKSLIYQALPLVFDRVFEQTGHNRKRGFSIHTKYMFENIAEQNGLTVLNKTMRCPEGSN